MSSHGVADDASEQKYRHIRQTVTQKYDPIHRQIIHAPEVLDLPFANTQPYGEQRGRTVHIYLNHLKASSITSTSATFNINLLNIGRFMPGTRVRPLNAAIAGALPSNGIVILSVGGLVVKDSVYADGTPANFQCMFTTVTNCSDFTGYTCRPSEVLNLDCVVGNTWTVQYAPDCIGTLPSLVSGFQLGLAFEEPANLDNTKR